MSNNVDDQNIIGNQTDIEIQKKLTNLSNKITKLNKLVKEYSNSTNEVTKYLDNIDDDLDTHDNTLDKLNRQCDLLIGELLRLRTDFDLYAMSAMKNRIINAASISVLINQLAAAGVVNTKLFSVHLKEAINEISELYKQEGININFDEELKMFEQVDTSSFMKVKNIKTKLKEHLKKSDENKSNIIDIQQFKKKIHIKNKDDD